MMAVSIQNLASLVVQRLQTMDSGFSEPTVTRKHLELLVVNSVLQWDTQAHSAHWSHIAHIWKCHLLAAAPVIIEAFSTVAAVMLSGNKGNLASHCIHLRHSSKLNGLSKAQRTCTMLSPLGECTNFLASLLATATA